MAAPTAPPPPKTVLRVAAISGSLRRASANTGLIRAAAEICRESIPGLQIDHVDISELPLLNTDLEVDGGFPPAVEAFRGADCFLFASPEYNYSISDCITHGSSDGAATAKDRPEGGGDLRLAAQGFGQHRPHPCRESIPGLQIDHVDISELPLLNTDLEVGGGFPPAVEAFRDKVREADCFLFASPEYNYSISGPLKNALDWGSRPPNCWADRAAAMLSASGSTGGSPSQYHIRQVGVFLDIHFINKPEVFTKAHQPPEKFDADGNLIDSETKEQVRKMLLSLQAFALRLQVKITTNISELPLLNTDLEVGGGFPPAVEAFRGKIREADCFLFASPEYNYSISGPLKNALDWGSRPPNCWADRAAAMLSASGSTGGSRSQYHIRQVGVFLDIHFINKPEVFTKAHLPPKKFDADGDLIDSETKEQVRKMLLSLQAFSLRLQGKSEQGN